jgi:Carboxypeptidase regulatory-like domain
VPARTPAATASPTTGTLVGSVDERVINLALPRASVRISGEEKRQVVTDSMGGFVIDSIKPGRYEVIAARIGYDGQRDSVQFSPGQVVTRQYHLGYMVCR